MGKLNHLLMVFYGLKQMGAIIELNLLVTMEWMEKCIHFRHSFENAVLNVITHSAYVSCDALAQKEIGNLF